jgi:hypothetical protein
VLGIAAITASTRAFACGALRSEKAFKDVALRGIQLFQVLADLGRLACPECFGLLEVGQVRGELPKLRQGWPPLAQALLANVTADLMMLTVRLLPRMPIHPENKTYTGWKADRLSLLLCSRGLLIEQGSYTMASGIILGHAEPLEPSFGPD